MKCFCIADEETVRGFRLAGVPGHEVHNPEQAAAALNEALSHTDYGLIILTEAVAADVHSQVETLRVERDWPLLVEIPGPQGPLPGRKSLRQLVQEAVGIRLGREGGA